MLSYQSVEFLHDDTLARGVCDAVTSSNGFSLQSCFGKVFLEESVSPSVSSLE